VGDDVDWVGWDADQCHHSADVSGEKLWHGERGFLGFVRSGSGSSVGDGDWMGFV
jgi:hypothetical protein